MKSFFLKHFSILVLFVIVSQPDFLFSQNKWQYLGAPGGGSVRCICESSNHLLYAGTDNSGIFISRDSGEYWEPASNGIANFDYGIYSLAVTKDNYVIAGSYNTIYRSSNNGASWEKPTTFFNASGSINDLITFQNVIFAGTNKGLFKSQDNGITWGIVDPKINQSIKSICVKDSIIFAVSDFQLSTFLSTDGGNTWTIKSDLPGGSATDVIINKEKKIYVGSMVGVFRSNDLGTTWQKIETGIPLTISTETLALDSSGQLFCSSNKYVYKLSKDLNSWAIFDSISTATEISFTILNSNNKLFLGDRGSGVYYYNNANLPRHQANLPNSIVKDLMVVDANNFYCLATGNFYEQFYKTSDCGKSWSASSLTNVVAGQLALTKNGQIICADKNNGADYSLVKGFSISSDYGNTWNSLNNGVSTKEWTPGKFVTSAIGSIVTDQVGNVFASIDGDLLCKYDFSQNKWEKIFSIRYNRNFKMINDSTLFTDEGYVGIIGMNNRYKSTILLGLNLNFNNRFYLGPIDCDSYKKTFYISYHEALDNPITHVSSWYRAQVYKGSTENPYHRVLSIDSTDIYDIKVDKLENVYVATGKGIYYSKDKGESFLKMEDELKNIPISGIRIAPDNRIFAISKMGIYALANYNSVKVMQNSIPTNSYLSQNYPNPFNPTTTINYSIPEVSFPSGEGNGRGVLVTLKVYDMLGREVATLINEYKQPGNYQVNFNAGHVERSRDIPSGVYFYRLQAGSFSQTKKFVLLK